MAVVLFLTVPMGRNPGGLGRAGPAWAVAGGRHVAEAPEPGAGSALLSHSPCQVPSARCLHVGRCGFPRDVAASGGVEMRACSSQRAGSHHPHCPRWPQWTTSCVGVRGRVPGELMERGLGHGHLLCAVLGTEEPGAGGADALHCGRSGRRGGTAWAGTTVFSPDGGRVGHTGRAEE